jgi:hypothetical protein
LSLLERVPYLTRLGVRLPSSSLINRQTINHKALLYTR